MVKKQQTDKKTKTEEYVGVKKNDLQKTAGLVVQQDEMIRQLRNMVERQGKTLEVLGEQRDKYMAQRDEALADVQTCRATIEEMMAFSVKKHDLFNQLYSIAEIDNSECQRLDDEMTKIEKKAKAYKVAFWVVLTTLAVIVIFAPFIKSAV